MPENTPEPLWNVTSPLVFGAAAAALIGYILYMIIRKRKGLRAGSSVSEPEI